MNSFKKALSSIRRSPYQTLVAFLVTFISLFLTLCFLTCIYIGNQVLTYYETQPQLIVFFKTEVTDDQVAAVRQQLLNNQSLQPLVKEIKLVSKQEAMDFYKQSYADDPLLLELISVDIFPSSLEISAYDPKNLGEISQAVVKLEQVEEVSYQEDVVETFLRWTQMIKNIGLAICVVLILLTFFVINIVIGMKVIAHREGIKIMQTIGATKFYIRKPFIIEALIYGLVSAILAWGAMTGLILGFGSNLQSFFAPIEIFPIPWMILLIELGLIVVLAVGLCFVASWRAVSRVMKRKA